MGATGFSFVGKELN